MADLRKNNRVKRRLGDVQANGKSQISLLLGEGWFLFLENGCGVMVAYVDVIILLNGSFDCLLLYWTSLLLKRRASPFRIFIGGAIGSLLIVLSFSPFYYLANSVLFKLCVSLFMVLAAFGYRRLKTFLKACLVFYFITFLAGGLLLGIHFLFSYKIGGDGLGLVYGVKSYGDPVSWLFVMFGFPLGWLFSKKVFAEMEMVQMLQEGIVDIVFKIKDCQFSCKGLIDTGNQLHEPITNIPVMIVSVDGSQVPEDVAILLKQQFHELDLDSYRNCGWADRIRMIPYKVVGQEQQFMMAFRPDWIMISNDTQRGIVPKGLVALTEQTLSHDDSYRCIVHPRMVMQLSDKGVS